MKYTFRKYSFFDIKNVDNMLTDFSPCKLGKLKKNIEQRRTILSQFKKNGLKNNQTK